LLQIKKGVKPDNILSSIHVTIITDVKFGCMKSKRDDTQMVKDVTKKEFMKMANTKIRKNFT
jgi:hypothetical protein